MKNQAFDFSINLLQALLWQHNNALNLQALIAAKQAWYDANNEGFWNNWVTDVFDLRTANTFGLAVWAVILGLPIAVVLDPDYQNKNVFGFKPFQYNFYKSNFGSLGQSVQPLTADQARILLQLRYQQLISRGTVPAINAALKWVFGSYGVAYVLDNLNMTMTYVFKFNLPFSLQFYLRQYDILPRPAGVSIAIVVSP